MHNSHCTILVADDDRFVREDLESLLKQSGRKLIFSSTAKETWAQVQEYQPDLVLLDIKFPDCQDLSVLKKIKEGYPGTEVMIISSQSENVSRIVEAIKLGAFDYVAKPFVPEELENRVQKALDIRALLRRQERLIAELQGRHQIDHLVGRSAVMEQARQTLRKLTDSDGCVLILGESGTGKELAARALHYLGKRRGNPFIVVNCASIPEALVESVFFGHKRGAFTGAMESTKGKFEAAENGTLFLDEIGDMPLVQQAALLRVLEYRRYTPVGEIQEKECRARFVLASNRDLRQAVKDGKFREDLFYRVHVATLTLPPLRSRLDDIPELVETTMNRLTAEMGQPPWKVHPEVLELFQRYDWPGNVRELKNVLEASVMLRDLSHACLTPDYLPSEILAMRGSSVTPDGQAISVTELRKKQELLAALQQAGGNQTQAAKIMGCHRNTIRARVRYYGISSLGA